MKREISKERKGERGGEQDNTSRLIPKVLLRVCFSNFLQRAPPQNIFGSNTSMTNVKIQQAMETVHAGGRFIINQKNFHC